MWNLKNPPGLTKVCDVLLNKNLDKMQTLSCWNKRPLRRE